MDIGTQNANAKTIQRELKWLAKVIDTRIRLYFKRESKFKSVYEILPPDLKNDGSIYAGSIIRYGLGFDERLIIILGLAPHVSPAVLDIFFTKNSIYNRVYTEFGGLKGVHHSGFLPTNETAVFILSGGDMPKRLELMQYFKDDHLLFRNNILRYNRQSHVEPKMSDALQVSKEFLTYFTSGTKYRPDFSTDFPAKYLNTNLEWNDLVLGENVLHEIGEIEVWLKYQNKIMVEWGLGRLLKPGYRALFYGPPGTGKTLTACLLGKSASLDVYRIDLSQLVSKYIGETEKNLANIFDQAEHKNWILFFDEAEALFGMRSVSNDAKDRYANQEIAYLLQRIEDFPGVIILATNLKANIDPAFSRRFQSIIYFPLPDTQQRFHLWKKAFNGNIQIDESVDFLEISRNFELSGGAIINVLRSSSISALSRNEEIIRRPDILEGIRKEFRKEGKTV